MTTPTRHGARELAVVEWLLRGAAVLAAAAALWMLLGANGFGLVSSYGRPGAPSDASLVMNERVTHRGGRRAGDRARSQPAARVARAALRRRRDVRPARPEPRRGGRARPTSRCSSGTRPAPQRWAWLLVRAVPAAFAAIGLWLLADLTRSARRGSPFTRRNVHRLMVLTSLVAAGGLIGDWGAAAVRFWVIDSSDLGSLVSPGGEMSFAFLGVVLLLGVVTEVWRRGVAMREDLDGPGVSGSRATATATGSPAGSTRCSRSAASRSPSSRRASGSRWSTSACSRTTGRGRSASRRSPRSARRSTASRATS